MVEEVFGNYFSNAINHVAGKRVIDVKLTLEEKKVRVSVFNTGAQIPEESLPGFYINEDEECGINGLINLCMANLSTTKQLVLKSGI